MTITPTTPRTVPDPIDIAFDLYRDIHKGIRSELFAVTLEAGRVDPASLADRTALTTQVASVIDLLVSHAEHEDTHIGPALETHVPDLAEAIETDHQRLESHMAVLADLAQVAGCATGPDQRRRTHQLHLELATFTSAYLAHQDLEERQVMPALQAAIGPDAVMAIHGQIIGSIPPPELMQTLAVMFPTMCIDDRTELLGGMQMSAPPEAFEAVVGLVRSVLSPTDAAAVCTRLGVS